MEKNLFKIGLLYVNIFLIQVMLLRYLDLYNVAFCFGFLLFPILLPKGSPLFNLIIGFLFGMSIDIFENTIGFNTACMVLIMYLRPRILALSDIETEDELITLRLVGFREFIVYSMLIIFIYCLFYFFVASFNLDFFWRNTGRIFASSLYTFVLILVSQYLFFHKQKR